MGLIKWLVTECRVGLVLIATVLPLATAVFFVIFDGLLRRLTRYGAEGQFRAHYRKRTQDLG